MALMSPGQLLEHASGRGCGVPVPLAAITGRCQ
jgi:hypothetical protein